MANKARIYDNCIYVLGAGTKETTLAGEKIDVFPVFVKDRKTTTLESATKWAENKWRTAGISPMFERPNDPISLRLLGIEIRGEGGRALKVADDSNHLFDLREDQFLAAITNGGIDSTGKFGAKFVWGSSGSQTKLFAVGGQEWNDHVAAKHHQLQDVKFKTKDDLVVGGVYISSKSINHRDYGSRRIGKSDDYRYQTTTYSVFLGFLEGHYVVYDKYTRKNNLATQSKRFPVFIDVDHTVHHKENFLSFDSPDEEFMKMIVNEGIPYGKTSTTRKIDFIRQVGVLDEKQLASYRERAYSKFIDHSVYERETGDTQPYPSHSHYFYSLGTSRTTWNEANAASGVKYADWQKRSRAWFNERLAWK